MTKSISIGFAVVIVLALAMAFAFAVAIPALAIVHKFTPSNECSGNKGGGAQAVQNGAVGGPANSPNGVAPVNAPVPLNNPGSGTPSGASVPTACT